MRILIACVGYRNLRDLSAGPLAADRLLARRWPLEIVVRDLSYGPVAVVQNLQDEAPFDRAIFLASVARGREPCGPYVYVWDRRLPAAAAIQACITEAITGVISLDNLLIIAEYFRVLPAEVTVIEIEPADTSWGEGLTPSAEAAFDRALETAIKLAGAPSGLPAAERAALGGLMMAN